METKKLYPWRTIASFLLVLFSMPLGHALMIIMEKTMSESAVHTAGFLLGLVGLIMVIVGVFVKGDTRQTLWGFIGGLLFWTGWVEFLFMYYARRYGVMPEMENGEIVTKPEYLIMPASFGMWVAIMVMYIFSTRNGCDFITWIQRKCFGRKQYTICAQPMTRHTSIVTFMEINTMLWTCYLLLMNLYDPQLFGRESPVTFGVAFGALLSAPYVFRKQLHLQSWGANIRMGTATVIVFWIAVEAFNRTGIIGKLIAHPSEYPWHWVVMVIELCFLAGKIVKDARAKKEKK